MPECWLFVVVDNGKKKLVGAANKFLGSSPKNWGGGSKEIGGSNNFFGQ